MQDRAFLLIAVPQGKGNKQGAEFRRLKASCCESADLCVAYRFELPALRMGTLDGLMSLCDDLARIDVAMEAACKRIVALRYSLNDEPEPLSVNNMNIDTYCIKFRWNEAKYPIKTPLASLVSTMHAESQKIDEHCRQRQQDWNSTTQQMAQAQRKQSGSLRDKDIDASVVPPGDVIDTEYLETVLVVLNSGQVQEFNSSYENLSPMVVPRSAKELLRVNDDVLIRVVMFKRAADDFRNACRENRYLVREYLGAVDQGNKSKSLERDAKKQAKELRRWTLVNFAEAFGAWVHVKGIRVFVESVLRYGPPARYETMLLLPVQNEKKKLRSTLESLYGSLTAMSMLAGDDDDEMGAAGESIYPYVCLDFDLELGADY